MFRRSVFGASMALGVVSFSLSCLAAPLSGAWLSSQDTAPSRILSTEISSACQWSRLDNAASSVALADALELMGEMCSSGDARDTNLLSLASTALSSWIEAVGEPEAAIHQARFFRILAALEARANLLPLTGMVEPATPALMLEPMAPSAPEDALFTVDEAAVPFLGLTEEDMSRVRIAVQAPGYEDLFTVYFPRGSAHLTLAAEDMIAMAAEATRGMDGLEIWIASAPALNKQLSTERMAVVYEILRLNEVSRPDIRMDDGGYDAILNRPTSLSDDPEA